MIDVNTLLCDMVKAIVDNPDEVSVTETVEGDSIILNLNVAEGDVGRKARKHRPLNQDCYQGSRKVNRQKDLG